MRTQIETTAPAAPPFEIDELNLHDDVTVIVLSNYMLDTTVQAFYNSPNKALNSLAARLAKIRHLWLGNTDLDSCKTIANLVVDHDGNEVD